MPKKKGLSLASIRASAARILATEWTVSWEETAFLLILAVAVLVRSYAFGDIPPGLNQDEASTAYDAFSILKTGADRHGIHFPVMLISWGDGMYAFASYVAIPFIALFGLSVWSLRLPHLIFGLTSLFLFYTLVREVTDRRTALLGLFLLSINPWHIMISRWALDSNLFPSVFLLATTLLVFSLRRAWLLPCAFGTYALCLYTYGTAYVEVPVFLALTSAYLLFFRKVHWRIFLCSALVFMVISLPVFLFVIINKYSLSTLATPFFTIPRLTSTPRFETIASQPKFTFDFLRTASSNLSILFRLLVTQNDGLLYNALPQFGIMYLFSLPFAILGFLTALPSLFRRKFQCHALFIFWFIAALLLGAVLAANINRLNIIVFPLIFFLAVGIRYIWASPAMPTVLIAAYLLAFGLFCRTYFTTFPREIASSFYVSFDEAIDFASEAQDGDICVTDRLNMPYIQVLVHRSIDPILFLRTRRLDPHTLHLGVESFGRYTFGINRCDRENTAAYVLENKELPDFLRTGEFDITHFAYFSVAIPRLAPGTPGEEDAVE
ncbi:MAG: glycosyltransferase family 39 protein [Candidatus Peregrinibacteria bacterium]|nr:glycosyltransferase family 39 protein [Candidatus Peregrinibacteria bacterium]